MKLTELFLGQLERETPGTRKALEQVPEGKNDWKPHEKSMPLGYLAALVASMPSWIDMMINTEEHDLANPSKYKAVPLATNVELLASFASAVEAARTALEKTDDEHLQKPWKLLYGGNVVYQEIRHKAILDSVSHMAHHRGQLTVYLRLNEAKVPSIYGPSADEASF